MRSLHIEDLKPCGCIRQTRLHSCPPPTPTVPGKARGRSFSNRQVDRIRFTHRAPPFAGCSTWSKDERLSHSRPHHGDKRRCVGKEGMTSHAVCCHAPALECHLVEKTSAEKGEVHIAHLHTKKPGRHLRCYVSDRPAGGAVLSTWLDHDRLQRYPPGSDPVGLRC